MKSHFNEDHQEKPEKCLRTVYLNSIDDFKNEITRLDSEDFNLNCKINYIVPEVLKEALEQSSKQKETYIELHDKAFEKGVLASFEFE